MANPETNESGAKIMTYGDLYRPAMSITDQGKADQYFELLVKHNMSFGENGREKAEEIERQNLAYFAGYYDDQTRERVEKLFKCAHSVFGAIAENGPPTIKQAFQMGMARGMAAKYFSQKATGDVLFQKPNAKQN